LIPERWTAKQDAILRRNYPRLRLSETAKLMGRSVSSIKSRAKRIGVQRGRNTYWTDKQRSVLKQNYRERGAPWCAKRLKRTVRQVYMQAVRLGLNQKRRSATDAQVIAGIRKRHRAGWSDNEIRRELTAKTGRTVDRHRVGRLRRKLGLPNNRRSEHSRKRVGRRTMVAVREAGCDSLAEVRNNRWNQWKREKGWPEHLSIRAVQALELFRHHRQLTRAQLCVLMGVSSAKRTAPISRRYGTVLAELQAEGLVTRLPKAIRVAGDLRLHGEAPDPSKRKSRFKYIDLYFLNAGVEPNHGDITETG